ncbi:MAG TPA: SRPBCC family protein [Longimicrobiales bacterium]|nr:SRPBCC family protein [Longimicrobiales bacterium]
MKKALLLIGAFALLALLLAAAGALLPVAHTAKIRFTLAQPPEAVYDVITDLATQHDWRTGLDSLRVLDAGPPVRWRESTGSGTLEFARTDQIRPRLVRAEIQGAREQGFGGTWTWDLIPADRGGTLVSITENGEVYNPLFRIFARTVFSPYRTLERYARDLGARFGEDVAPERVVG